MLQTLICYLHIAGFDWAFARSLQIQKLKSSEITKTRRHGEKKVPCSFYKNILEVCDGSTYEIYTTSRAFHSISASEMDLNGKEQKWQPRK